jgi:hypothetical protein
MANFGDVQISVKQIAISLEKRITDTSLLPSELMHTMHFMQR